MAKKKTLTRPEIEYTLERSGFVNTARNFWIKSYNLGWSKQNRTFKVGSKYIICDRFTTLVLAELTPKKWTQATGLKFHPMEEK